MTSDEETPGEEALLVAARLKPDPASAVMLAKLRRNLFAASDPPTKIDHYELLGTLGQGAMGTVFEARDPVLERRVALKLLNRRADIDNKALLTEARTLAKLANDNVVTVHDAGSFEDQVYLVMELVEGPTLQQIIATAAPLPAERVVALGLGIARGLEAAHQAGVIHRDLKPANILVADGDVPKIADFGMARASSLAGVDRSAFAVLGTPDYMAPESLEPLAVDARSDLYALGCILFEMATGRPPFSGATSFAVLEQHRKAAVPPISGAPPQLAALIEQLLEKQPADRVQSASGVARMLEQIEQGETALVPHRAAMKDLGRCAQCGAPLVDALRLCLSCRAPAPRLAVGEHTVFVTGPGEVAAKLHAKDRATLTGWLRANPSLGVDSAGLEEKIPRLPFALLTGVDEPGAKQLAAALRQLGLEAEAVVGGTLALPAARKKARVLVGRVAGIVATSMAGMYSTFAQTPWMVFLLPLILFGVSGVVGLRTLKPKAKHNGTKALLPPTLEERMDAVSTVAAAMESKRHRESLRGVVLRVLALREATGADGSVDDEAASAIDQALVATGRLDTIDRALQSVDLQNPTDEFHALMHERDTWSARLLDLVGTLETLRVRLAASKGAAGSSEDVLATLRAKVEALEEVQRDV